MGFGYFVYVLYAYVLALMIVGLPQPFSLPPLPEDPALLRIVPADSIAAFAWNGAATPDPRSTNQTERLAAEPEVRNAIDALRRATVAMLGKNLQGAGGIARAAVDLACVALQRPGCVFLRHSDRLPKKRLEAGLALKLGDETKKGRALLDLLNLALRANLRGEKHEDIEVDDVRFRALPTDVEHEFLGWAEVDGWLLVAIGEATPALMLRGLQDLDQGLRGNADCQRLLAATAVARPATRTFVDVARTVGLLRQSAGEHADRIAAAFGLGTATVALATSGLDGDGFKWQVELDANKRDGLLGALVGEPIGQDALLPVPADADLAIALRADPVQLERALFAFGSAMFGSDTDGDSASFEREFAQEFGVEWRRDLLQNLDGQITAWNAPSQGGLGVTAATATLGLRDGAKFGEAWAKVIAKVREHVPSKADRGDERERGRYETYLESVAVGDHTLHWFDTGRNAPFAFALAATPTTFVAGLMPSPVRATLEAFDGPNPDRSLVRWPNINRRGRATALVHLDARSLLTSTWPLLMLQFPELSRDWQDEGFAFDASDLPRLDALTAHLGRELTTLEPRNGGYRLARTGTLPVFDPLTVAGAILVASVFAN